MQNIWLRAALLNFLVAAIMGAMLRFAFVQEIPGLHFKWFLHGHSHGAMLGWLYLALFSLFIGAFLPEEEQSKSLYNGLFWVTELSVIGMFVSFPLQGYGKVSIIFSTVHIIASYIFAFRLLACMHGQQTFSAKLARTALVWMVISSFGVFAMAPIMQSALKGSAWYYMAVQFFLHFQFNGWFIFGALALFFRWLEKESLIVEGYWQSGFYWVMVLSVPLTFALAIAWSNPHPLVFAVNSAGGVAQLLALWQLRLMVQPQLSAIRAKTDAWKFSLWQIALYSLIAKILIQGLVVIPEVARMAYTIRNFVIGFVHLIMLGVMSLFIFAYIAQETGLIGQGQRHRAGLSIFLTGILLSEGLLFLQGIMFWAKLGFLPGYYYGLFLASMLLPIGLFLLIWPQRHTTL